MAISQDSLNNCKKCETEFSGNYCPDCGHPRELARINRQYILQEIGSVLNFDKGILYSIRELIIRPGQNIREFILEDRNRLVKPIIFIIICSLVYTISNQLFDFEDGYINYENTSNHTTTAIFEWIQKSYGYANIIMGIFIAFWIRILFRKYDYNFFETLILLCFIMGIGMLIYSVLGIAEGIFKIKILYFAGIIPVLYSSWAIGQFFDKRKKINYLKAFISYFLGMLSFTFSALALGLVIEMIK